MQPANNSSRTSTKLQSHTTSFRTKRWHNYRTKDPTQSRSGQKNRHHFRTMSAMRKRTWFYETICIPVATIYTWSLDRSHKEATSSRAISIRAANWLYVFGRTTAVLCNFMNSLPQWFSSLAGPLLVLFCNSKVFSVSSMWFFSHC